MVRAFDEIPRDTGRVIFFPRAAGGAALGRTMIVALSRHRDRRARAAVGDLDAVDRPPAGGTSRAARAPQRRRSRRRLRPGPRAARRAARARAAAVVRQRGGVGDVPRPRVPARLGRPVASPTGRATSRGVDYAYLIYPHKPIVAYLPQTGRLLNEYCVEFPDETRPYGSPRLPDSDDVLAKWMALNGDERRIIAEANMHLPGRQVDPRQIQRDLWRLGRWERERLARALRARRRAASGRPSPPTRKLTAVMDGQRLDPKHKSAPAHRGARRAPPRAPTSTASASTPRRWPSRSSASPRPGSRRCPATSACARSPPRSRRASAPPAARRWSSTRSRSPTASRWARAA